MKKILYWIPALLVMVLIFYFSSKTGTESNSQSDPIVFSLLRWLDLSPELKLFISFIVRKLGHISEYFLLGASLVYAFYHTLKGKDHIVLVSIGIGYLYAITDEIHQLFVPGRTGALIDTGIDLIGICIGVFIIYQILKWIGKRGIKFKQK